MPDFNGTYKFIGKKSDAQVNDKVYGKDDKQKLRCMEIYNKESLLILGWQEGNQEGILPRKSDVYTIT